MIAWILAGQETHRQHAHCARSDGALQRDHLPRSGLDVPFHAQQAWDGEAPDVGVEDADGQASRGQGHGQVDRDRGFADPTFARGDGQHAGGRGDRRIGSVLACLPPGPRHDGGPLVRVHGRHLHVDGTDPVERAHVVEDVLLDLTPQRAGGDGQGHVDDHVPVRDSDGPDHAQIHDGVPELGVDHRPQAVADLLLTDRPRASPRRGRRCGGRGHTRDQCTCVAGNSGSSGPGCSATSSAGNMGAFVAHRTPRVVGRQA